MLPIKHCPPLIYNVPNLNVNGLLGRNRDDLQTDHRAQIESIPNSQGNLLY